MAKDKVKKEKKGKKSNKEEEAILTPPAKEKKGKKKKYDAEAALDIKKEKKGKKKEKETPPEPEVKKDKKGKKGKKEAKPDHEAKKEKKGKKEKKSKLEKAIDKMGTEEEPFIIGDEVDKKEIFKAILDMSDNYDEGDIYFQTHAGIVKLAKGKTTSGATSMRWMLDGSRISKNDLTIALAGITKKEKKGGKKDKFKEEASKQLLLTQTQLDAKYKTGHLVDALEFMQFGKKKIRAKAAEAVTNIGKKAKGGEIIKALESEFGTILTADLFHIFENMESQANAKEM